MFNMQKLSQITNTIKQNFLQNNVIQKAYGLDTSKSFDEQFSAVSIESAIISVVSFTWYLLEQIMESFRTEIDERIESSYIASIPWYYDRVMEYQHGYDVVFNPATYKFEYQEVDSEAMIVKFAAVRQVQDIITKLRIYTNKEGNIPLTTEEHDAFKAYIQKIGAAGIHYDFVNLNPDNLKFSLQVIFNPLILDSTGAKLTDGSFPVRDAINEHVSGLGFGGTLNRTRLIDAIQNAQGVEDVILTEILHAPDGEEYEEVTGQNVISASGSFVIDEINDTYTPNV